MGPPVSLMGPPAVRALPQDMFVRGTLRGVLARGGVVIEELCWNMTLMTMEAKVNLRSAVAQSVILRCIDMGRVSAEDSADQKLVSKEKTGWRIHLPAGRALRLICTLE